MNPPPRKKEQSNSGINTSSTQQSHQQTKAENNKEDSIVAQMIKVIKSLDNLQNYPIRLLVEHTEHFGIFLKNSRLETSQIRKFLDAMNRAKDKLIALESDENIQNISDEGDRAKAKFAILEPELVFLKPKLFYAAGRQKSAESFKEVISEAIDKVLDVKDFKRLTELIEATVAYHTHHKQAGKSNS